MSETLECSIAQTCWCCQFIWLGAKLPLPLPGIPQVACSPVRTRDPFQQHQPGCGKLMEWSAVAADSTREPVPVGFLRFGGGGGGFAPSTPTPDLTAVGFVFVSPTPQNKLSALFLMTGQATRAMYTWPLNATLDGL